MRARLLSSAFLVALLATNVVFGKTFNVTNPDEFKNALTEAASNSENDTINVAAGIYNITSPLTYSTNDGDGGHTLTIQGAGTDKTILDGGKSVRIMDINTDTDKNGDDSGGDVTIEGMAFNNGKHTLYGGGLYVNGYGANITIKQCAFSGNSAGYYYGGGVYVSLHSGTTTITNNTFSGNSADYGGGGGVYVSSQSGTTIITNNTFSGNSANYGGGVGAYLEDDSASLDVYNNILFDNIANAGGNDGDDLYVDSDGDGNSIGSTVNLYNNDFSGNANFETGQSEDLSITYTDNYHHANNIQDDPQFVDPVNGDFHLKPTSSCIDKGTADAPGLPETDFEGDPRIMNDTVDIGADECHNSAKPMPWLHLLLGE